MSTMKKDDIDWLLQDLLGVVIAVGILLLFAFAIGLGSALAG
jgi:hypothetical protein